MKKIMLIFVMTMLVTTLSGCFNSFRLMHDTSYNSYIIYRTEEKIYTQESDELHRVNKDGTSEWIEFPGWISNYINNHIIAEIDTEYDDIDQMVRMSFGKFDLEGNLLAKFNIQNDYIEHDTPIEGVHWCSMTTVGDKIYLFISIGYTLQMHIIDFETFEIEETFETTVDIMGREVVIDDIIIENEDSITFYLMEIRGAATITKLTFNIEDKIFNKEVFNLDFDIDNRYDVREINGNIFIFSEHDKSGNDINKLFKLDFDLNLIKEYDLGEYHLQYIDNISNTILIIDNNGDNTIAKVLDENFDVIEEYIINKRCTLLYKFNDETFYCWSAFTTGGHELFPADYKDEEEILQGELV